MQGLSTSFVRLFDCITETHSFFFRRSANKNIEVKNEEILPNYLREKVFEINISIGKEMREWRFKESKI